MATCAPSLAAISCGERDGSRSTVVVSVSMTATWPSRTGRALAPSPPPHIAEIDERGFETRHDVGIARGKRFFALLGFLELNYATDGEQRVQAQRRRIDNAGKLGRAAPALVASAS